MPIRAILFDKDGVLIDIQKTLGPGTCDVLRRISAGDRAMFHRLAEVSNVDAGRQLLLPGCPVISEATDVYGTLWAQTLGRPYTNDFGREIDRLFLEATLTHLCPIGDPHALLSVLAGKGYRLGIMTNDADTNTWAQLRHLGIEALFALVAGYDSGFGQKPDAAPVLTFAAAAGVAPAEVAVVGDSPHDLIAARAAGAVAIGVLSGPNDAAALGAHADVLLSSIQKLEPWLCSNAAAD